MGFHLTLDIIMFSSSTKTKVEKEKCVKPLIRVSSHVKNLCSVYIEKGRFHSTASKLSQTKVKCMRVGRELEILNNRFRVI